jgi:hypothetical protein
MTINSLFLSASIKTLGPTASAAYYKKRQIGAYSIGKTVLGKLSCSDKKQKIKACVTHIFGHISGPKKSCHTKWLSCNDLDRLQIVALTKHSLILISHLKLDLDICTLPPLFC